MNSIQEQWTLFERTVVPGNAPAVQRLEMKLAFYGGAEAILRILWNVSGDKNHSEDAGIAILEGLHDECRRFSREYGSRIGLPQPIIDAITPVKPGGPAS